MFGLPEESGSEGNYGIPWKNMESQADLDLLETGRATRPQILFQTLDLLRFERYDAQAV